MTVDTFTLLGAADSLSQPTLLLLHDDSLLAIADRDRVVLITLDGAPAGTLGRGGSGPGEFSYLRSIGTEGMGIAAVDRNSRRWALFGSDGRLRESGVLAEAEGRFVNLDPGRITLVDGALWLAWRSLGGEGQPMRAALFSHPVTGEPASLIAQLEGQPMIGGTMGVLLPRELFGPYPRLAIAPDGRFGMGDGVEYCVLIDDAQAALPPRRVCREWSRVRVPEGVRRPDYDALMAASGRDADFFAPFKEVLDQVTVGNARHSYTRFHFDEEGRLWVQAADSSTVNVHPILGRFVPEQLPKYTQWDVFDVDGRLIVELRLPRAFSPMDARGGTIYGLVQTEEGAMDAARLVIPEGIFDPKRTRAQ